MKNLITCPMAVSIPTNAEGDHQYELVITPEGVFGRHNTGVKGRANRWAMYHMDKGHKEAVPELPMLMRAGTVELDEDELKAIVERGYATGDEASVTVALKKMLEKTPLPMVIQNQTKGDDWIASTPAPTWTPEPVAVEPEPVLELDDEPMIEATETTEMPRVLVADPVAIVDAGNLDMSKILAVHDNAAAYVVPKAVEDWVPVKFTDTEIDAMEYLERAKKGGWNIAITGRTGCGKSALCYNTAVKWETPYAAIPFSEATDTTALWDEPLLVPDGRGGTRSVRVLTAAGMVAKYGGIMEWQEVNGAADAMLTAIYGVLDFGRAITLSNGTTIPLHKDTIIIATQNPVDAAHSHASHMSAALDRRFWHVEMGYMEEIEARLVPHKSLREIAGEIRSSGIVQPFGTDSLVKVHKAIEDFGLKQGVTGLITMFRDPAAREVVRPIVDVRLAELARDYAQEISSDVEDIEAELVF